MTMPDVETETWVPELTFGARIALVRHKMGWNIKEAAVACGVPAQSWRGWEVDGREPHRLITIAMAIATRTGCDLDWLVYGPNRKGTAAPSGRYGDRTRVIAAITAHEPPWSPDPSRRIRRTRPTMVRSSRPLTPSAI